MQSQYLTEGWTIARVKLRGYNVAFNLNGFQDSTIRDCDIDGAAWNAFVLLNSNASYRPNGGAVVHNVLRGTTGTVLKTNYQNTRSLLFAWNTLDGTAVTGLDCAGGTANSTTASVKALGNVANGTVTTLVTGGTNTPGALNANLNNVAT
jgi:hypothetical protein